MMQILNVFLRSIVIRDPDGEQRGPYSVDEVVELVASAKLDPKAPAWSEQRREWVPLSEMLNPRPMESSSGPVHSGTLPCIKIGWACLVIGLLTFRIFELGFAFFVASFALSGLGMFTNKVNQGIALNIATFVASELVLHILLS